MRFGIKSNYFLTISKDFLQRNASVLSPFSHPFFRVAGSWRDLLLKERKKRIVE